MNNPKSRSGSNAGSGDAWYLRRGGKQYGPFTIRRLREFVDAGKVKPTTQASRDGRRWIPASDVPGLFPEVVPAEGIDFGPEPEPTPMEGFAGCDEFIIVRNGRESTPVKFEKLQRLAQAGGLRPDDELLQELNGFRMSLGLAKEQDWFPGYEPPAPAPKPPQKPAAGHAIGKVAAIVSGCTLLIVALAVTIGVLAKAGSAEQEEDFQVGVVQNAAADQVPTFQGTPPAEAPDLATSRPRMPEMDVARLAGLANKVIAAGDALVSIAETGDDLKTAEAQMAVERSFMSLINDPSLEEAVRTDEWLAWRIRVQEATSCVFQLKQGADRLDAMERAGRRQEFQSMHTQFFNACGNRWYELTVESRIPQVPGIDALAEFVDRPLLESIAGNPKAKSAVDTAELATQCDQIGFDAENIEMLRKFISRPGPFNFVVRAPNESEDEFRARVVATSKLVATSNLMASSKRPLSAETFRRINDSLSALDRWLADAIISAARFPHDPALAERFTLCWFLCARNSMISEPTFSVPLVQLVRSGDFVADLTLSASASELFQSLPSLARIPASSYPTLFKYVTEFVECRLLTSPGQPAGDSTPCDEQTKSKLLAETLDSLAKSAPIQPAGRAVPSADEPEFKYGSYDRNKPCAGCGRTVSGSSIWWAVRTKPQISGTMWLDLVGGEFCSKECAAAWWIANPSKRQR